jgi:hypothetical protein
VGFRAIHNYWYALWMEILSCASQYIRSAAGILTDRRRLSGPAGKSLNGKWKSALRRSGSESAARRTNAIELVCEPSSANRRNNHARLTRLRDT